MEMQTTSSQYKKYTGSASQFAFQAPTTRQVSLAGDFNNWDTNAAPMQKAPDGIWRLSVSLAPGRYEYRFYADGVWRDDPTAQQRVFNALGTENCVRFIKDTGRVGVSVTEAIADVASVLESFHSSKRNCTSVTAAIADVAGSAVRGRVQAGADLGQATQGMK